jgi:hypothetical protein
MNAKHESRPVSRSWFRIGLLVLATVPLGCGLWALLLPRTFYDDFPLPGRYWVSTLGPYNEHLVRDYGALNLALGVLLLFTVVLLERRLVQVSLVAWLAYAIPHFVFHLTQVHHFSLGDNLSQLVTLGLVILLPLILLVLASRVEQREEGSETASGGGEGGCGG